ncbi:MULTISPECIES: DinB family protein [Streptomyces]|uniref:DinB family protein n=1 Tax=Streptomyces TaxID=1883 RepID=UPI001397C20C|nr:MULTISPECIES: DinB family protein [unclassified Streptomyces]QPA02113.1 serine/arginine repetitive matrix protein 1 [Streptomyces violascens]WDV33722.1 DinB family protein [Streptomyces sp. AD16]WSB19395.1 DinB family protein [Streptomyces albidoflavus]MBP3080847.1 serine/arginine repetitive matrix protein 1 [Streptomyces sp. 604F]QHV84212.1 serine/arginine repetitive matrix protein 1 [Streptomyces sp. 604F]
MTTDWNALLTDQLDWYWTHLLRPRLAGLTDAEYFWEPVEGCWNIRPAGTSPWPSAAGSGDWTIDYAFPEPAPPPVTTISWRLGHLVVGVLGTRLAAHFGGPETDYGSFAYAGTAEEALRQLDTRYAEWTAGVRSLGQKGLEQPCGPSEGPFAEAPMGALVLHITREIVHHGAETGTLRDLWAHRPLTG